MYLLAIMRQASEQSDADHDANNVEEDELGSSQSKSKQERKRRRTAQAVDPSTWIFTPIDGWASKRAIDFKGLKQACKQRGLSHNNRQNRDASVSLLVEFDATHTITEIANQRIAFTSGLSGNVETESGRWTQNCWARLVHILTTQNIILK